MTVLNTINPLNPELNPICYLLALLGAHHFLHVSRIRVNSGTYVPVAFMQVTTLPMLERRLPACPSC